MFYLLFLSAESIPKSWWKIYFFKVDEKFIYESKNLYFISDLKNSSLCNRRIRPMETIEKEIFEKWVIKLYANFQIMWDIWLIGKRSCELLKLLCIVLDELSCWNCLPKSQMRFLWKFLKVHQKILVWRTQYITPFIEVLQSLVKFYNSTKILYIYFHFLIFFPNPSPNPNQYQP